MASHDRETMNSPEFQTDCDKLSEENNIMYPNGSPSESNFTSSGWSTYSYLSDFSSSFGSEMGSTETESEDDDFITELNQLTRRMAEYTFQDDDEEFKKEAPVVAGTTASDSPQKGSGLSAKWSQQGNSTSVYLCDKGLTSASQKSNSVSGLAKDINSEICSSDQVLIDEQMRPPQVYDLKNQPQLRKQGLEQGGGKRVKGSEQSKGHQNKQNKEGKAWRNGNRKRMNPPPPVLPQSGSGMRAVFLGGSNTRTGSCGTGVFLPSGTYTTAEPKRKSGCSTVLIPARVLQTLQHHFNNVGGQSQSISSGSSRNLPCQNDVLARINGLLSQEKEHVEFQTRRAGTKHDEVVQLPQEWTY